MFYDIGSLHGVNVTDLGDVKDLVDVTKVASVGATSVSGSESGANEPRKSEKPDGRISQDLEEKFN